MAHFARIDENNTVICVLVVDDSLEHRGEDFLANDLGLGGTWIKTSYNTYGNVHSKGGIPVHKNFAGIGDKWDGIGFYSPSPFPSWVKNEITYLWEAPIEKPDDGEKYEWSEENLNWVKYTE